MRKHQKAKPIPVCFINRFRTIIVPMPKGAISELVKVPPTWNPGFQCWNFDIIPDWRELIKQMECNMYYIVRRLRYSSSAYYIKQTPAPDSNPLIAEVSFYSYNFVLRISSHGVQLFIRNMKKGGKFIKNSYMMKCNYDKKRHSVTSKAYWINPMLFTNLERLIRFIRAMFYIDLPSRQRQNSYRYKYRKVRNKVSDNIKIGKKLQTF